MPFLNALILKNRNFEPGRRGETEKLFNYEMEDGHSETDHQTCSSRTDESDLILFSEASMSLGSGVKGQRKANRRSSGSNNLSDPAFMPVASNARKTHPLDQSARSSSEVSAADLSECDISISNHKVVEEASPSDRVIYGYGETTTQEDIGTETRTRSSSMPLNKVMSQNPHPSRVEAPLMKPGRSTSLSHKQTKSNILVGGGFSSGATSIRGQRAVSLSNGTRQPPISSLFSGANSRKPPRRLLSPQNMTKPLARLSENDTFHGLPSLVPSDQTIIPTEEKQPCATTRYESLGGSIKENTAGSDSDSSNSFCCLSFDESANDSDDDLLIETAIQAIGPTDITAAFQSGATLTKVDSSERSFGQETSSMPRDIHFDPIDYDMSPQCPSHFFLHNEEGDNFDSVRDDKIRNKFAEARKLPAMDDKTFSPKVDKSPRSPRRILRSGSGDLGKQQEEQMASRLAAAKLLLGIDGDKDSPKVDSSPQSPRRVVRGDSGYLVHQHESALPNRLAALLDTHGEKASPKVDTSPRSPQRVMRAHSGDFEDQRQKPKIKAEALLNPGGDIAPPGRDISPRSPRRVTRGHNGFFVHQEQSPMTRRVANAKILLDNDDKQPSVGDSSDSLSRSDNFRRTRQSRDPLSRSDHTSAILRPRLLKTESARLARSDHTPAAPRRRLLKAESARIMYTKHEDLLAEYEKIIEADDTEEIMKSTRRNSATGATKRISSPIRSTSRRLGLRHAESARGLLSQEHGGGLGQNERGSNGRESFESPSRSKSLILDIFHSPLKKNKAHKSWKLEEAGKMTNFSSPSRSSSLLSSWKRSSPTRKGSGLSLLSPLPILQSIRGPTTSNSAKSHSEEISSLTHKEPEDPDKDSARSGSSPSRFKQKLSSSPRRTSSLYSPGKFTERSSGSNTEHLAPKRKSIGNCSARMELPMIEPLPGISLAGISDRPSTHLRKATSLRALDLNPSGDGLSHLFDEYSAIVDSPSGSCVTSGLK